LHNGDLNFAYTLEKVFSQNFRNCKSVTGCFFYNLENYLTSIINKDLYAN